MNHTSLSLHRFLLILVVLALLGTLAPSAAAQGGIADAQVVTTYLNMRAEPGDGAALVQRLSYGTLLTLLGRNQDGSWLFVSTDAGVVGWVATNWVALRGDIVVGTLPITTQTGAPAAPEVVTNIVEPAAPGAAPVGQATGQSGGATAVVVSRVNLRSGPGTQYASYGVLNMGTTVVLQGRDYSTLWVLGTTGSGTTGWMAARYLSANLAVVQSLPLADGSTPTGSSPAPAAVTVQQPQAAAQPAAAQQPVVQQPASVTTAPITSTTPMTGFAYGGQVRGYSQQGWMQAAGMTWVKQQVTYNLGADPSGVAGLINDAHARGFRILLSIKGHPSDLANVPNYINTFASYLGGVAALGADAIEVWNEMNLDREWPAGRIDPNWYTQMLAAAYNAIKGRNPNTMVISGAPSPTGAEGAFGTNRVWNDDRYMRGMAAAGAAQYMDCIGIHYNEGIISPNQRSGDPRDGYYTRYFWGMVDTYWNAFGGQRPLCFTELGYLSPEGYGALPGGFSWAQNVTVAQQAQWLGEAVSLARSSGRVRLLIVWNVDYTGTFGADPQGGYAIVRPGGDCPACRAMAAAR